MLQCDQCRFIMPCPVCSRKTGVCVDCGCPILPTSTRCRRCQGKINITNLTIRSAPAKIVWPPVDVLEERICVGGQSETARWLGVTRNALVKHFKKAKAKELEAWLDTKIQKAGADLRSVKDSENGSENNLQDVN